MNELEDVKLNLISTENWEGFYVNGELVFEDHSISAETILSYLFGESFEYEWVEDIGGYNFTDRLEDLVTFD